MMKLRKLGIAIGLPLVALLLLATEVLAVGLITDFIGVATPTTISLLWTKSVSSDNTTIRYSTSSYPVFPDSGTSAYSGSGNYVTLSNLTAGTPYYFSAFAYDGFSYSVAKQLSVTTLAPIAENSTIPFPTPSLPASTWQNPSTGGWSWYPLDQIVAYFADPTYAHGGLGMPTDNLVMFIFGLIVTGLGLWLYVKWHNFFAAYTVVFIASFFGVSIGVMQGYVIGMEILIGMGVWAVEHNFQ